MKEQYRETEVVQSITGIQFGLISPDSIQQLSHLNVISSDLYSGHDSREPAANGVLDQRMGISQKDARCKTCSKDLANCVGHYGYLDLELPVFHVGYFKSTITILQNICKRCAHVLLKAKDRIQYLEQIRKLDSYMQKKVIHKKVNELCKKVATCENCGAHNGMVKKMAPLKIIHDRNRNVKKAEEAALKAVHTSMFEFAMKDNKEVESLVSTGFSEVLDPGKVLQLFSEIPVSHLPLLCMDNNICHPKDLILTRILVAPNCIRPSVISELKSGTNEDDITTTLGEILFLNNLLKKWSGGKIHGLQETWDYLQLHCAFLFNAEISIPQDIGQKRRVRRGFVQRLKGKQGRFRGNLSGKRVDFSSRTVISPDPNLRINEVGVPVEIAKILYYPEKVTKHNIELMRTLIRNGPDVYPGACIWIKRGKEENKKSLKFTNRTMCANEVKTGDIVERHLLDGDIVLFNRQPSLHKMSIMSHRVKIMPWRTFRFNECVCSPYNADFDGDEMNLHVPQNEEARAEALTLMATTSNLVTPRHGALIIGPTQDFLTGTYLLTQKDRFFDFEHACNLAGSMLASKEAYCRIDLPPPAIVKPKRLWTGKQIFSLTLKMSKDSKVNCNLIAKRKDYSKHEEFCVNEAWVIIRNSELLAGALDKSLVGSGGKKNIFYVMLKDYGKQETADAMWRVARMSIYYIMNKGFSIGIGDVMPGAGLLRRKKELLDEGYKMCKKYIAQNRDGELQCQPGCNADETLEQLILKELSDIREYSGKACVMELHKTNAALLMAMSGSKGSFINISQMIACVGQQAINGKRVPNGFLERALPHFARHSKIPEAKGFVSNSFFTGMTPTEFIFHTMGGREGLVDTAVKTAETGYMQRRLVKCLEDLYIAYDMTVRNSTQNVVQFRYGADGLDPVEMEEADSPFDLNRLLNHIRATEPSVDEDPLDGSELVDVGEKFLTHDAFKDLPEEFKAKIKSFLRTIKKRVNRVRSKLSCGPDGLNTAQKQVERITISQLLSFLRTCEARYHLAVIEPGTAVGALCAQSIGEPGTQMTLKTFHFAGVAAMNITLGVPRILEIINASKNISTPIVTAKLMVDNDAEKARQVKGRIEKTLLGEVCEYIEEVFLPDDCFLLLKLNSRIIQLLKLEVDAGSIQYSICSSKLKLKDFDVQVQSDTIITIRPAKNKSSSMYYQLQHLKQNICKVVIKGLPSVNRAVINQSDTGPNGSSQYMLYVEGDNLQEVIATYGVKGTACMSNNIFEVYKTLGIEAARTTIIREITSTMENHGLTVDHRHIMLLADLMTCRGQVLGITRHGLAKMKESVLNLASFEKTSDHLFDAAYFGQRDEITGVSDCIIMGKPMNIGTGIFKLLHKHDKVTKPRQTQLVFDQPNFHSVRDQMNWV